MLSRVDTVQFTVSTIGTGRIVLNDPSIIKINLFSELWKLIKLELSASEYIILYKRATELETPVHEALLDANFFQYDILLDIFIPADLKYICTSGLLDTYKNQIEI